MKANPDYARADRIGRWRLSDSFFMRDFLHSEIAAAYGLVNLPDDEDCARTAGEGLCQNLLEPLQAHFGRIHVRSAYRSSTVNVLGNARGLNCAANEKNFAGHIWDRRDTEGRTGATACIVLPAFASRFREQGDWVELAWWIHDHLPYCSLEFFKANWACNVTWSDRPKRQITSWTGWFEAGEWTSKRNLTRPAMANHAGDHSSSYARLGKHFVL